MLSLISREVWSAITSSVLHKKYLPIRTADCSLDELRNADTVYGLIRYRARNIIVQGHWKVINIAKLTKTQGFHIRLW